MRWLRTYVVEENSEKTPLTDALRFEEWRNDCVLNITLLAGWRRRAKPPKLWPKAITLTD